LAPSNTAIEARLQPVVPLPAPAAETSNIAGERHYVQVGAFSSMRSAQGLQKQLQQSTGRAVEVQTTATAPVLYRVRVGPLASREQAEQVRGDLIGSGARDARVVSE